MSHVFKVEELQRLPNSKAYKMEHVSRNLVIISQGYLNKNLHCEDCSTFN